MNETKKSGMLKLAPGEVIFNDGDSANSLYIIQKGQIRLYKPKGKGFVEIGVARAGEVLGEMAYFEQKGEGKRSCSAAAIAPTEVIEISFNVFAKTMESLNPWFKTIINTLADRLRKSNTRVKELESNQVSGYGAAKNSYNFFRNQDIVRILSTFFLVFKTHGTLKDGAVQLHMNTLNFYAVEIFNIQDTKMAEFEALFKSLGYLRILPDENNLPKLLSVPDVQILRSLLVFFNSERNVTDEKRVSVNEKCEMLLDRMYKVIRDEGLKPDKAHMINIDLKPIIDEFKSRNIVIDIDDLADAIKCGLCEEPMVDGGGVVVKVNYKHLKDLLPPIQVMNAIKRVNESKSGRSSNY